ncbi:MAG: chitobiase/beta-hexosaminidase C-terminal domain-containing protein, partial [Lachnospiraceae bacterium]|nr:chitobiase/beta-hexosaminidase C-terminal domain-containing protein [Lachnospiraceae bacterium]
MKKILSHALVALAFCVAVGATAQDRKTWDFTKGLSAETTANLKADSNWKDSGETDTEADGTPRSWTNANKITETISFIANGVEIEELAGLKLTKSGVSSGSDFRIGVQTETLRPIMGLPDGYGRFRLCRANMELVLPALKAGQKVQVDFMSAAPSDKGGGRYLTSEQMTAIDGAPAGDAYVDLTRYVVTFQVNDDIVEPTEIILKSTNGVDIFSINIDGGGGVVEEAKKVAFVGSAEDMLMSALDESRLDITSIGADDEVTLDSLQQFEAVIVSNTVAADAKIVPVLKSAIAHQPMVNFNAALYEAWGLGKAVVSDAQSVTLTEGFAADETFASIANGEALLMDGMLSTIELGDYFANDAVIATIGDKVAMHRHNAGRNTYINVPMDAACVPTFDGPNAMFTELAVYAASTKRGVVATAAPKIEQVNGNMETAVTITAAAGAVIHYTLDGTEPTVA